MSLMINGLFPFLLYNERSKEIILSMFLCQITIERVAINIFAIKAYSSYELMKERIKRLTMNDAQIGKLQRKYFILKMLFYGFLAVYFFLAII